MGILVGVGWPIILRGVEALFVFQRDGCIVWYMWIRVIAVVMVWPRVGSRREMRTGLIQGRNAVGRIVSVGGGQLLIGSVWKVLRTGIWVRRLRVIVIICRHFERWTDGSKEVSQVSQVMRCRRWECSTSVRSPVPLRRRQTRKRNEQKSVESRWLKRV